MIKFRRLLYSNNLFNLSSSQPNSVQHELHCFASPTSHPPAKHTINNLKALLLGDFHICLSWKDLEYPGCDELPIMCADDPKVRDRNGSPTEQQRDQQRNRQRNVHLPCAHFTDQLCHETSPTNSKPPTGTRKHAHTHIPPSPSPSREGSQRNLGQDRQFRGLMVQQRTECDVASAEWVRVRRREQGMVRRTRWRRQQGQRRGVGSTRRGGTVGIVSSCEAHEHGGEDAVITTMDWVGLLACVAEVEQVLTCDDVYWRVSRNHRTHQTTNPPNHEPTEPPIHPPRRQQGKGLQDARRVDNLLEPARDLWPYYHWA